MSNPAWELYDDAMYGIIRPCPDCGGKRYQDEDGIRCRSCEGVYWENNAPTGTPAANEETGAPPKPAEAKTVEPEKTEGGDTALTTEDMGKVPDSWKPKQAPEPITPPHWDETDPGQLEAFFGNFGHWEHWRKVVQANCSEIVRAEYALRNEKVTETRLELLTRVHPNYLQFLIDGLKGRTLREENVLASGLK